MGKVQTERVAQMIESFDAVVAKQHKLLDIIQELVDYIDTTPNVDPQVEKYGKMAVEVLGGAN